MSSRGIALALCRPRSSSLLSFLLKLYSLKVPGANAQAETHLSVTLHLTVLDLTTFIGFRWKAILLLRAMAGIVNKRTSAPYKL